MGGGSNASCGPRVGTVQYWRCDFERKTKDEGDEDDSGFREKESRYSHRGRISSVAFVTEKSPESFVDDQFPWLSSKKNLGGVARRRISVAMSIGESLWLSSTEEIGGSPLQTNSSAGAKLNRKEQWRSCVTPALGSLALSGAWVESLLSSIFKSELMDTGDHQKSESEKGSINGNGSGVWSPQIFQ
ncbi:hypothetical protein HID58_095115, partial [Brassica napus]